MIAGGVLVLPAEEVSALSYHQMLVLAVFLASGCRRLVQSCLTGNPGEIER